MRGTILLRFLTWILAGAGLSIGQAAWMVWVGMYERFSRVFWKGFGAFAFLELLLLALLLTTPPAAIRLRARNSVVVVLGVTILLRATDVWVNFHAPATMIFTTFVIVIATALLVRQCIQMRVSVWWAALVGWCPAWVFVGQLT